MQISKFTPIAIVGTSLNPGKYGYKITTDLIKSEYQVFPINPKGGTIQNTNILTSLQEIPKKFIQDLLVIIIVPPQITEKIVEQCIKLKINKIWFQPGSESAKAIKIAHLNNIETISNACFMLKQKIW